MSTIDECEKCKVIFPQYDASHDELREILSDAHYILRNTEINLYLENSLLKHSFELRSPIKINTYTYILDDQYKNEHIVYVSTCAHCDSIIIKIERVITKFFIEIQGHDVINCLKRESCY